MKRGKLKKLLSTLTASALALSLCATMGMTTLAEGTETDKTAYVTKNLTMSDLTATPASTFTFDITKNTAEAGMETDGPTVSSKTISYADTDAGVSANDVKEVIKTVDILSDATFTHAGVYRYDVVENATTSSFTDTGAEVGDQVMTYSKAEYKMYVYVANKADGSGVYIENIIVYKVKDDDGNDLTTPEKVDPTDPGEDGTGNGFAFVNVFNVKGGSDVDPTKPDPENPTGPEVDDPDYGKALRIQKTTAGKYADTSKTFAFSVNITKAPTDKGTGTYSANLIKADGTTSAVSLTAGTATSFVLAHGDKLVVDKDQMVVGTKFEVTETGAAGYTPSALVASNGVVTTYNTAGEGDSLSIPATKIGALNNHADVTNTSATTTPPTGVALGSVSVIALLALAAAAVAVYVISRKRSMI